MSPRLRHLLLTTSALLVLGSLPGAAGPDGANVVGGSASVQGQGTGSVIVNQSSDRAIINWNTFNIGTGESARFNQPGPSSVILNRVIGGLGPSTIDGTLTANGRVFVVNGDGLVIGSHAVINTAGFLATTSDIKNKDFMAGRYNFNRPGQPDASIVNQGHITATSGGFAALVAPGVRNSGTISATLGTVALASGNMFTLDLYGDRLIQIGVGDKIASQVLDVATGRPLSSLVTNDGKLRANGGRVELTAAAARRVVDSVINTTGVVEANSVGRRNGMIVIGAATAGSRGADLPRQTVRIAGRISAAGKRKDTTGGTVVVTGEDIQIANAQINASGRAGGGRVLIGGDWGGGKPNKSLVANPSAKLESFVIPTATTVSIDAATTINASATGHGNGGKVVLWSGSETTFAGTILARGGARSGDGGFVEVSSPQLLNYSGTTDTRAPKGAVGTLLLDPENFYVNANGLPPNSDPTASAISADTLVNQLASNNVVLSTLPSGTHAGDIFVDAHVSWSTGNSLTLSAFHDILFMSGTQVTNTGAGNLVLRADNTGTGQGIVVFNPGGHVDYMQSTGTVAIFYNPSGFQTTKYQNPTNYFCPPCPGGGGVFGQQPSQLTAYMLVNNASDLQAVSTNLGGTYALGRNIDASTFTASIPGTFTGLFDGNGGLGVNYAVDHLPVGLFSTIGSGGAVRNLSLTNVSLTANADGTFGPLASINNGTITNVSAAGAVSDASSFVVIAGGLVGQNSGSIARSFANVSVTASNSQFSILGGLVGLNSGDIARSSAIGTIASGNSAAVGGLVGANSGGSISESFAGGNVSAGNSSFVGGLVGINGNNDTGGSISASYATGAVTAGTGSSIGGLVGTQVSDGTVENSFATGRVSGGSLAGGLIGFNDGGSITGSYWDRQTTGQLTSSGSPDSAGLTTVQLQAALPSGWDSSVWGIVPGVSYPYLNWQFPVGTPQVVSGVAFNDHGITPVAGGTVVGGVLSGSLLRSVLTGGPVTTGANGYYYYLLPPGTISPPATQLGVGTFQAGPLAGGTYLQNAAGSTIHLDIYGTYLRGITGEGTLSAFNTGLATAIGSNPGIAAVVNALPNRQIEAKGASFAIDEALHATGSATVTAAGPLTIAAGANVTGTDVVLATPGAFVNNAGSAAVTASNRWLIYSNNPDADTFGNLDSGNTAIWNATPNSLPPANVTAAGNRYIFAFQPTLMFTSTDVHKTYGDDASAAVASAFTVAGFQPGVAHAFLGDTAATAFSGAPSLTSAGAVATASVAGSPYPITISAGSLTSPSGYAFAFGSAGVLTVNPATLTYTADVVSRLYGSPNPAFNGTVTGFVNGESLASATTGVLSFTSPATTTSNVGNYAINGSGLIANNSNYVFVQAAGNTTALSVNPTTLTYVADPTSRLYGAANPAFGGTVLGFVNGENLATATTGTLAFSSTATTASNVGNYPITGSGLVANNGNYVFNQATGNATALTINPATLTYTANAANRLYGADNPVFGGTVAGFVNGETLATATTGAASFTSPANASSNVGNYAINGSGLVANHGNYVFAQAAGNATALAVTPRPLTITADDASKTEGQTLTFAGTEFHANGLVNGDAVAAVTLTSPGAAATALAANSPFAIRATDPLGSGLGNYAISFVDGTLTVNANPQQTTTTQIVQQLVNQAQQASTTQIVQQLVNQPQPPTTPPQLFNLIALNPPATSGGSGQSSPPQQQPPGPTGSRVIDIPPPTESRFVKDEVVFQIAGNVTVERLQAAVGRLGLTLLASENLATTGSTVARFRITDGRSPAEIIPALAAIQLVGVAQPNYVYTLQQQPSNPVPASRGDATQGDPAQYMLEKLKISEIHRMVRGANVPIAVIDSEIDVTHPDLEGAVTKRFDAVGAPENAHAHGTGMAGAIAAHRRLLGTAPAARLLAVQAFPSTAATAESTTFNILKGINWSVQEGARIINMSFAGPRDPSLARALKAAYDKGIVLIAAAGNAGPKSPPLFPGADPYVIAVTATDVDDKLFTGANRGKHISVAAPGVDILVPAPEGNYQITTGTSVAAAEVSGIVALLLERNPKLTPADIRRILIASAKRLAPGERDDNFGSGLIDPLQALQLADPRIATTTPPRRR